MGSDHRAFVRRVIVGVVSCVAVASCALTKTPAAVELVPSTPVNLNVREMPMTRLVEMLTRPVAVAGLEQLGESTATMHARAVPARDVLRSVLNCAGFTYEERGDALAIVRLTADSASAPCIAVDWNLN